MKFDNRIYEIDVIKTVGILLVVAAHITRMYTPNGLIHPVEQSLFFQKITDVIYRFHMPMFVFVSGYTFSLVSYKHNGYDNFKSFICNNT